MSLIVSGVLRDCFHFYVFTGGGDGGCGGMCVFLP
jgi:hypothetical protein